MRKIIVLEFLSLDGVIQSPGAPKEDTSGDFKYGGWTVPYSDDESNKEMQEQMSKPFDLLLGRKTFEIWENYWPKHSENWPEVMTATKYVVSSNMKESSWDKSVFINENIVEELKKLKNEEGPDLQVYGSSILVQTLLKNDLVDELWLKTFPITLGKGKRLFVESIPAAFELIHSKVTPSGVIFASYKRAGEVKTGSF